ncbi:MAG: sensor histidine kinase, partial [Gammaproteobacteria bacterium]|nr:sensor histidine kinase [Gammaproteobacteria bacterium]
AIRHEWHSSDFYILRATIDAEMLSEQILTAGLPPSDDVFLVNREGVLQTSSRRYGAALSRMPLAIPPYSPGVQILEQEDEHGERVFLAYSYVESSPFVLMYLKPVGSVLGMWVSLRSELLGFLAVSGALILGVVLWGSGLFVDSLRRENRRRAALMHQVEYTNKLASIGRLAAGVAHEINNPLGGMLNAINTFRRHGSDPAVAERTLDLLQRGLVQIQQTVHALLVEARVQDRPLAEEDLEDVRTLVQADAGGKGVRLEWDCRLGGATALPSAPVRHVLINLLLNAIRAAPEGGRVRASCAVSDDRLRLRVADDGPGLPPAVRARLFEPQPSASGGHGFGLWVTHQTVKRLGGQIEARDGAPGTVFEVVLPATIPETTP